VNIHSAAFPPGEIRGQLSLFEEQSFSFTVDEAQANDCNGTGSSATGLAEVKLKPGGLESTISIVHDVSNVIDGHVHLGEKCVSGDVQFGFDSPLSTVTEIWYLSSEDVINLMQGDLYVNIHSMTFQDGEIRGQIENSIPTSCCVGLTGNVDGDPTDMVDLGDLTALIDFLFISFTPPECMAEANVDGDPSGSIDLGDLTALIDFLFISFTLPAECL
jgi:hypothetical protein